MTIDREYYDAEKGCYDFSRDVDKKGAVTMDRTTTVYPAMAWWDPADSSGKSILAHPEGCLKQLAGHTLNTDWGLRDVANDEKIYDGLSYHQGSVWPLFTGWAAMAEYRGGQPLAGYQMLMENVNLTKAQDLGSVTELLSGDYFVPFGRSTSHQLWSSAMVITPVLRGLFGIGIDAQKKTITVNPHLPAGWEHAHVENLLLDEKRASISFSRVNGILTASFDDWGHPGWKLRSDTPGAQLRKDPTSSNGLMLAFPTPDVEVAASSHLFPMPGDRTRTFRVVSEKYEARKITLEVEGLAGSQADLVLKRNRLVSPQPSASDGLKCDDSFADGPGVCLVFIDTAYRDWKVPESLQIHFPGGEGWKTITVTLSW
jgi:hypothetical protein